MTFSIKCANIIGRGLIAVKQSNSTKFLKWNGKAVIKTILEKIILVLALLLTTSTVHAQTLSIEMLSAQRISFFGNPETEYILQSSTNLTDWQDVGVMVEGKGGSLYTYTNVTPVTAQMFYRTRTPVISVNVRLSASSPLERIVQISDGTETPNVVLAAFDIKALANSTSRKISFYMYETTQKNITNIFSQLGLRVGATSYAPNSITHLEGEKNIFLVEFAELPVQQPAETYVTYTISGTVKADIDHEISGAKVIAMIAARGSYNGSDNNPVVEDTTHTTLSVSKAQVSGNIAVLTSAHIAVINGYANLGKPVIVNSTDVAYPATFTIGVMAGNEAVYVSKDAMTAFGVVVSPGAIFGPTVTVGTPAEVAGDGQSYFIIPAGSTRTFNVSGLVQNAEGSGPGLRAVRMTSVNYGLTPANLTAYSVNHGLQYVQVSPMF